MQQYITDYRPLASYAVLAALGLGVILIDTLIKKDHRAVVCWITAIGAAVALGLEWTAPDGSPWQGILIFDAFSRAFNAVFLLTLILVCVGSAAEEPKMRFAGEYCGLMVFATIGLMLAASAGGLLALYIGVDLATICLFALVGFAKRERRSAEAALKMFVIGGVASAVTLYGASLVYGVLGTTQYAGMAQALSGVSGLGAQVALWLGLVLVVGGLAFKVSAVPFHLWAPDVYEGAPTTVSAFLSTASKAGGFAALLRLLLMGLPSLGDRWAALVVLLAALSMVLGNLVAICQSNLKRLLAYSGIAQAGYILVAVAGEANATNGYGVSSVFLYLLLYAFTNVGGFLIVQAVADATGSDRIAALRGLHRRNPALAFSMLVVLFSLGGIPPLAGFVGKLYLFAAGWSGGQYGLVLLGAITSVIALYYYLLVALAVYIQDPPDDRRLRVSSPLGFSIAFCVLLTIVIGVYPRPWVQIGQRAAEAVSRPLPTNRQAERPPIEARLAEGTPQP